MLRKRVLLLATAAGLAVSAEARQQILSNGSFEIPNPDIVTIPPLGWSLFNAAAARTNAESLDGDWSVAASLDAAAFIGGFQDTVSVIEGVRILGQCFVLIDAPLTGDSAVGIKYEFQPPEGIVVPPPTEVLEFGVPDPNDPNDPASITDDVWTQISLTVQVPPNMNIARAVIISFDEDPNNGPVYVDSAHLEFDTNPGVNVLLNPSFELGGSGPNGLTNWSEFAGVGSGARRNVFEVPADAGSAVCKITGVTSGLTQNVPAVPGTTLTFRARYRSSSSIGSYASVNARAGVKIEWLPGGVPPQVDIAVNANPVSATTNILNADDAGAVGVWTPVTIDYTMDPATAAKIRGTIISGFGPDAGVDVWFDNFEIVLTNVFNGSDADTDDDEDMADIAQLQRTFTGAGGGMAFGGMVFDHDEDQDVDISDSDVVLPLMTGPAAP